MVASWASSYLTTAWIASRPCSSQSSRRSRPGRAGSASAATACRWPPWRRCSCTWRRTRRPSARWTICRRRWFAIARSVDRSRYSLRAHRTRACKTRGWLSKATVKRKVIPHLLHSFKTESPRNVCNSHQLVESKSLNRQFQCRSIINWY